MDNLDAGGEIFHSVAEIENFIEQCNRSNEIITSIEFFVIKNEEIRPFEELISIDSGSLYDEKKSRKENAEVCNGFISSCLGKCIKELTGLYFCATIA